MARVLVEQGIGAELGAEALADADVYLAVAASLLAGEIVTPVGPGSSQTAAELAAFATEAEGIASLSLFGVPRDVDFSQFEPRGHYRDSPELERYFRAMSWLGLLDLRLVETDEYGQRWFRRRQLELAYALGELLDESGFLAWQAIDDTIGAFVGEADNMTLPELDALLDDLGLDSAARLANLDDQTIAQAIIDRGYGAQKISGHLLENFTGAEIPLSAAFLLFGKRYVIDSHVFQNVVYARVPETRGKRMMPNTLDVAFAALGNDGAAALLAPDPTIADVHTQPADEGGNIVGRVLHVGTGPARLMVVTVDSCTGPRAYVGLASSYFERITEDFERLTDQAWAGELMVTTPDDVPWMADLVSR